MRNCFSRPSCTIQRAATPAPSGVSSSRTTSIPPPHIARRPSLLSSSIGQCHSTWYGVSLPCPQGQVGDPISGTPTWYRKLASPVRNCLPKLFIEVSKYGNKLSLLPKYFPANPARFKNKHPLLSNNLRSRFSKK